MKNILSWSLNYIYCSWETYICLWYHSCLKIRHYHSLTVNSALKIVFKSVCTLYISYICVYVKYQHNLPVVSLASLSVMSSYLVFTSSRWEQLGTNTSSACSFFPYTPLMVCLLHSHLLSQISIMSSPLATLVYIWVQDKISWAGWLSSEMWLTHSPWLSITMSRIWQEQAQDCSGGS